MRDFLLFRNQLTGQLTRAPVHGGCQEGLCHPPVVFAVTPLREGSGGPFKVVGGGSLWGVLSVAELGALVPKPLC